MPDKQTLTPHRPHKKWTSLSLREAALQHVQEAVFFIDPQKNLHPLNFKAKQYFDEFDAIRCKEAFLCSASHVGPCLSCDKCFFHQTSQEQQETEYIYPLDRNRHFRIRLVPHQHNHVLAFVSPEPFPLASSDTNDSTLDAQPSILKEIACGVLIADPQSHVLFANHTTHILLANDQLIGKSLHELFPTISLATNGEQRILRVGSPSNPRVLGYRCTEISSHRHTKEIFLNLTDLTQLEHLQKETARLEKLAEMGRLSSIMIHEIRNPLAGIQAMIQSMRSEVASLGLDYAMDMITDEIKRLSHLLTEYSLLRGNHEPRRQQTNLRKVLDLVAFSCKHRLESVEYTFELHKVPLLWVDAEHMRQLFLNLVLNALDALDAPNNTNNKPTKRLRLYGRVQESNLVVDVEDNGCGIPPQNQDKVFDAFYTTKPHGTGLGLVVCQKIVKEHKGSIQLQSSTSAGTHIKVTLPLLEAT